MLKAAIFTALSGAAMAANNFYLGPWGSERMSFAPLEGFCQPNSLANTQSYEYICLNDSHIEVVLYNGDKCTSSNLQCVCKACDVDAPDSITDPCTIYGRDTTQDYPELIVYDEDDAQDRFRCDGDDYYTVIVAATGSTVDATDSCDSSGVDVACTTDICFDPGFTTDAGSYYYLGAQDVGCSSTSAWMTYYLKDIAGGNNANESCYAANMGAAPSSVAIDESGCELLVEAYKGDAGTNIFARGVYCGDSYSWTPDNDLVTPATTEDSANVVMYMSAFAVAFVTLLLN